MAEGKSPGESGDERDERDEQTERVEMPTVSADQDAIMEQRGQRDPAGPPRDGPPPQQSYGQQPGGFGAPVYIGVPQRTGASIGSATKGIGWMILVVCIAAIVGSLGPWASSHWHLGEALGSFHQSMNGFGHLSGNAPPAAKGSGSNLPHDGIVVTVFAVVVGIFAIVRAFGKAAVVAGVAAVVSGLIAVVVSIWCIRAYGDKNDTLQQQAAQLNGAATASLSSGWGVWLVLICGIVLVLLGIAGIVKRR